MMSLAEELMEAQLIGKRIMIPGQFTGTLMVENVTIYDDTVLLKVRVVPRK
jgi:hypothetical protein